VSKTIDGRYVVERFLGEGGMGVVYAGRHKLIGKRVAIKVLRRDMANDAELNERFLQEARAASAIGNPHIVDISDFGQLPDGSTYFVMELLEGKSLGAALLEANGPLSVSRLCHIAEQIAQGLGAAHAATIVHRDLKPDNVMLVSRGAESDFVKILDFGIAKVGSGTKKMTRAGSVFGTPHYMSPEQAAGAAVDHRTDIYALGVIMYEMVSGKVPFDADNFMGILTQHIYKAPAPFRTLEPVVEVSAGLEAIVLKCLSKNPDGRYATMDDLVTDLERLERGEQPGAMAEMTARSGSNLPPDYFHSAAALPAPVAAQPARSRRRWPLVTAVSAMGIVGGLAGMSLVSRRPIGRAQGRPTVVAAPDQVDPSGSASASLVVPPASTAALAGGPSVQLAPVTAALTTEVLVSVTPNDATIARDGAELGGPPIAIHLADGEVASLVISRRGYKTKTVKVDASQPKATFSLDPLPLPPATKAAAPPDPPRPAPGGIDDVGDPFANKKPTP
jgi:serine/threonine-protein kinase